jgi:hypothetical protein
MGISRQYAPELEHSFNLADREVQPPFTFVSPLALRAALGRR